MNTTIARQPNPNAGDDNHYRDAAAIVADYREKLAGSPPDLVFALKLAEVALERESARFKDEVQKILSLLGNALDGLPSSERAEPWHRIRKLLKVEPEVLDVVGRELGISDDAGVQR